jgi:hypothetical protein
MTISSEDLALIRNHGVPAEPGPEFLTFSEEGAVTFTERGKRLYRMAMLLHGMSPKLVESVRTREELREVALQVKQVRLMLVQDEAERALNNGKIPPKAREMVHAVVYGTYEDFRAATERRLQCEAAGPNVIPLVFGKKK